MSEFEKKKILAWSLAIYAIASLLAMAPMNIGAGLVMAALIYSAGGFSGLKQLFKKEYRENPGTRLFLKLSCALAAACALSLICALIWPVFIAGHRIEIHFFPDLLKAWYLFWPVILIVALRQLKSREQVLVLSAWVWAFLVLSIVGVIQHKTGWPRRQEIPGNDHYYHAVLFLGHHLSVASVFIFPFFAVLDLLSSKEKSKLTWLNKKLVWAAAVFGFATLFATYSRALWVALPAGMLVWFLGVVPRKLRVPSVIAFAVLVLIALQIPVISNRVHDAMGHTQRQFLWEENIKFFESRPLTGIGWKHTIDASSYAMPARFPDIAVRDLFFGHAHNMVLEMAAGTGIIGLLAWLAWVVGTFILCGRAMKVSKTSPNLSWGIFCALIVLQINGLTQVNFWEGKVIHQLMWVLAWVLLWQKSSKSAKA